MGHYRRVVAAPILLWATAAQAQPIRAVVPPWPVPLAMARVYVATRPVFEVPLAQWQVDPVPGVVAFPVPAWLQRDQLAVQVDVCDVNGLCSDLSNERPVPAARVVSICFDADCVRVSP